MLLRQGFKKALCNTQKQTQGSCQIEKTKIWPNRKNKTPENELNKKEITNLSDAEFKTLVIRMLKELIEYFNSMKKTQAEMKVTLSEIKKNLQGTNSGRDETEYQMNDLEHKEEKSIQSEQQEEKRIQKTHGIRSLWYISKCTNIQMIGVPEEEKEQEIEN